MLSLAVVKGAASNKMAEYYTKEYTQGSGEMTQSQEEAARRSRWWGDGADARGLEGSVQNEDLQKVLEGRDPESNQVLFDPSRQQLLSIQKSLGIERTLGAEDIKSLRRGLNPETHEAMPRVTAKYVENLFSGRRGLDRSVSAVDMTLSAPKSVSLMVAVGDDGVREAAEGAHEKAVDAAMEFVRDELAAVRRGHDGLNQEAATELAAALVTQLASRNHDPQLHTHCVLSTAARGSDGRVSALNATMLHKASKVIGSVYQNELRHQLTSELGVGWDVRLDGLGEVAGVPKEVMREFSTRTKEIDASVDAQMEADQQLLRDVELRLDVYERAALRVKRDPDNATSEDKDRADKLEQYHKVLRSSFQDGKFNASRKRLLVQLTRQGKDEPAEEQLREKWQQQWLASGESWDSILQRSQGERIDEEIDRLKSEDHVEDFRAALSAELTTQNATFGRKEAITTGLRVADPSMSSQEVVEQVDAFLEDRALSIREDTAQYANWSMGGGAKYTTEEVLEQEKELKEVAGRMLDRDDSAVCNLNTTAQKAEEYTLNDEQESLLTSMCVSGQQLVMARGIAGSGKTHVLGSAASVLRTEGYQVVGLATAAATAQRLSAESGFDRSSSIDRFLQLAKNGKWERGTSKILLSQREELQSEKRTIAAKYSALLTEAGDDEVMLDQVSQERADALEDWQRRWDEWLTEAGRELETRENSGKALDARRETLDLLKAELDHREHTVGMMPADQQQVEMQKIRQEREELEQANQRWKNDSMIYQREMSPTEDLPDDNRVVIVVDEAGMVETSHYSNLLKMAEERDWKVAFVGDDRQLQEVNRGGSFRMLAELGGSVELGTARRARNEWEQQAQRKWWASEDPNAIQDVAQDYIDHDRVTFITDRVVRTAIASEKLDPDQLDPEQVEREVARQVMVDNYFKDYDQGVEHLLIASKREDVFALNNAVQQELIKRGVVKSDGSVAKAADVRGSKVGGWYDLHAGDSLMVMKNISGTPVKNGMNGTITRVNQDGSVTAKLPTGPDGELRSHTVEKKLLDDGYAALGNAVTAHKSQGMSVENATAMLDKSTSREAAYPSMTRGKGSNQVVWLVDKNGGEPEEQLAQAMTKTSRKLTALEQWKKEPTQEEISELRNTMSADGVDITADRATELLEERRRQEYLEATAKADERDAKMELAHERLEEQKESQAYVMQHEHVHVREHRLK